MLNKKIVLANWKSNHSIDQLDSWIRAVARTPISEKYHIIFAPPFSLIAPAYTCIQSQQSYISLSTQDISAYPQGAYTGEVCAENLKSLEVKYAMIGHSERRKYQHETALDIAKKLEQCIENQLTPILCIEKKTINELANVIEKLPPKTIILYETPEYIGSGSTEPLEQIQEVVSRIRSTFDRFHSTISILYGGSVGMNTPATFFLNQDYLDGVVLGTASLHEDEFIASLQ